MKGIFSALAHWMRGRIFLVLAVLAGVGLFVLTVVALDVLARRRIRDWDRDAIAFSAIDCPPPPGDNAADFLGEVQYLAGMPDRLHLLDEDLVARLAQAFARHPWVRKVERIEKNLPARKVQVQLVYRTPVLAVAVADKEAKRLGGLSSFETRLSKNAKMGQGRMVDGEGILLPVAASGSGLPYLKSRVPPPAGPPGTPWGDAVVEAAARTAGFLRPYQDIFQVEALEMTADGLVLSTSRPSRVLWGRAPGAETADEAAAGKKVQRLLDFCGQHGGLGSEKEPREHDVRPVAKALHRSLPK